MSEGGGQQAMAVFCCRPNSHPFDDRHIPLSEPVKIGRSVARARPAVGNAIFDCKVLSRNHALIWYENGKFYLQDTKSSNGTFVNNQRLSRGSEESPAREISSGDIIQFGVDVMENQRKVTHSCIVATVTLYLPDGKEAKQSSYASQQPKPLSYSQASQELYQLHQYLQEALHREQMLEQKLATLQRLVISTQEASDSGWQALVDEDRLLSKLEMLESQMQIYTSKGTTDETLRKELQVLQDNKENYETTAKDSLKRVLQEKLEAVRKLQDLERSFSQTEDECTHVREMCEASEKELSAMASKHHEQLKEVEELTDKLQDAQERCHEIEERTEKEKKEVELKIDDMKKKEEVLLAKIESLQADNDFTKEQLSAVKNKMDKIKNNDNIIIKDIEKKDQLIITSKSDGDGQEENHVPYENNVPSENGAGHLDALKDTQEKIEYYNNLLTQKDKIILDTRRQVTDLKSQLEKAQSNTLVNMNSIASFEEKLKFSNIHIDQVMETAVSDVHSQLKESRTQNEQSDVLVTQLKKRVAELELEMRRKQLHSEDTIVENDRMLHTHNHVSDSGDQVDGHEATVSMLSDQLEKSKESQESMSVEVERFKRELDEANVSLKTQSDQVASMQKQLSDMTRQLSEKSSLVKSMQDELKAQKEFAKIHNKENKQLQNKLAAAEQDMKTSHNETKKLRDKAKALSEELEAEKSKEQQSPKSNQSNYVPSEGDRKKLNALREECSSLRKRITQNEAEIKISRSENEHLTSEHGKLKEAYRTLEEGWRKDGLRAVYSDKQLIGANDTGSGQASAAFRTHQVEEMQAEVAAWEDRCSQYDNQLIVLRNQLDDVLADYGNLEHRSTTLSVCSMIPIIMLLLAMFVSVYQPLARWTNTNNDDDV